MQKYRSHKVVVAVKIESIEKLEDGSDRCLLHYGNYHGEHVVVSHNHMNKHEPKVGGYYVRYPDGYESYSPAEAFEEGYTAVAPPDEQARDPAITALRDARGACEMTGPPLSDAVPAGSQAGIDAITRGLSKARNERNDLDRSMHVLAAQIRTLRADAKRMVDLEELLREAIPGLKNYGQGSDTYDLIQRIKAILP